MKRHDTNLCKNIGLSLYFPKWSKETSQRERERERWGDRLKLAGDCYIDLFLTRVVVPYAGP